MQDKNLVKLNGIRKNCFKFFEEVTPIIVECVRKEINEQDYFVVLNGITGNERIAFEQLKKRGFTKGKNWVACYGNTNRWDQLEVLGEDIEKYLKEIQSENISN